MLHLLFDFKFFLIFNLLVWVYLIFFHGRKIFSSEPYFWTNEVFFRSYPQLMNNNTEVIAVIIPARNEQHTIKQTLRSIIRQKGILKEIILIDDNSIDLTVKNAKEIFKKEKFSKYHIIKGRPLKKGWSGKVWALHQGTEYVRKKKKFKFFLFVDSDIVLKEKTISSLVLKIKRKKLLMISLMAKLNCKSTWEKLLIPSFIYFFQQIYPFNEVNKRNSKISAAAGGCILCCSSLFQKTNLFAQIKNKVIDDCNLASIIKKKGPIWLGLTTNIKSSREYSNLNDLWKMVTRTAYEQLNNSIVLLIICILAMLLIYLIAPFFILIYFFNSSISDQYLIISIISTFLMYISFLPTAKFYKISFLFFILFPISSLIYVLMTINSALNFYFSSGNVWKNRKYKL